MKRKIAGREVNAVGLGCMSMSWGYGSVPDENHSIRLLNQALDCGYNHLDTANIYGSGRNETLIGKALKNRRQEFFLATKMGIFIDGENRSIDCSPAAINRCVDESLTRLQTDHIDLYYMHRPDRSVPIEESMGAMADLVKAGKIGSVGLSEMDAETLRGAAAVHPVAAMQTEYSPCTRNPEIAVLDACRETGTTFVAFSPVARGFLAGGVRDITKLEQNDLRRNMPRMSAENWPHNLKLLDAFEAIASEAGVTLAQLSLAWVLAQGDHIVAIPGTTAIGHMEENFAAQGIAISSEIIVKVNATINQETIAGNRYSEFMQSTVTTEQFAA